MQHPVHVRHAVRTAQVLQQLVHIRLAIRASNQIDPPRLTQRTVKTGTSIYQPRPTSATHNDRPAAFNDSTDLSYTQRSSNCTQRLDRPQFPATIIQLHPTTRPTSATSNDHLAAPIYDSNIPATDITHLAKDKYNCHGLYKRAYKHDNKLSSLLYLLPRLCFLHCLWMSLLARFNLNHLRGRRAYRLRNKLPYLPIYEMYGLFGLFEYYNIQ